MTDQYQALIDVASKELEARYSKPVHSVASALRTKSGEVIVALSVDHFNSFVCAETAALSKAMNEGYYEFDSVVAVRKDKEKNTVIANMCGKCRQIFHDYAPAINVISYDFNRSDYVVKTIDELLPFAFTRQREKLQEIVEGLA